MPNAVNETPAADQEIDARLAVVAEAVSTLANPIPILEDIEAELDILNEEEADPEALNAIHTNAITLLDAPPPCDVVFLAHHGLEGFARISDIRQGALVGRTVRLKFWRVPAASIPAGRDERLAWLAEQWQRMDDWIHAVAQEPSRA